MRIFVLHNHPGAIQQFGYCNVHGSYEGISIREKILAAMIIEIDQDGYAEIKQNKTMLSKEIPGRVWGPEERMHYKLAPEHFPKDKLSEPAPGVFVKTLDCGGFLVDAEIPRSYQSALEDAEDNE